MRLYFPHSILLILLLISLNVSAQKLPKQLGKRAPANIRVDGSANEWDQSLLAYNNATEVFYELANDDNNLYLLITARKREVMEKILMGGITLTIDPSGKKNTKGVKVTFPTYYKNEHPNINLKTMPHAGKDTALYRTQADSFRRAVNQQLADKSKLIEVEGVKAISDSLISTYNNQGIKAAALFDHQLNYIAEFAIPIKYLNLSNAGNFSYQIKLNGATTNNARIQLSNNGQFFLVMGSNGNYAVPAGSQYTSYVYATDFWGEYALARANQ